MTNPDQAARPDLESDWIRGDLSAPKQPCNSLSLSIQGRPPLRSLLVGNGLISEEQLQQDHEMLDLSGSLRPYVEGPLIGLQKSMVAAGHRSLTQEGLRLCLGGTSSV